MARTLPAASASPTADAPLDERTLLLRSASGDAAAAGRLVGEHQARVARLAHRLLGWCGEVDDVVQDVFVSALQSADRFRGDAALATWLCRITVNECRRRGRRGSLRWSLFARVARRVQPPPVAPSPAAARAPGEQLAEAQTHAAVRAAVAELPQSFREVIVLRYLEERETSEICAILSLSRSAVEVRLSRARGRLKQQFAKLGLG